MSRFDDGKFLCAPSKEPLWEDRRFAGMHGSPVDLSVHIPEGELVECLQYRCRLTRRRCQERRRASIAAGDREAFCASCVQGACLSGEEVDMFSGLTVSETASITGIPVHLLHTMIRKGQIPEARLAKGYRGRSRKTLIPRGWVMARAKEKDD